MVAMQTSWWLLCRLTGCGCHTDFGPYGPQRIENCATFQLMLFALMLVSAFTVDSIRAFYARVLSCSLRRSATLLPPRAGVETTDVPLATVSLAAGPLAPMVEVCALPRTPSLGHNLKRASSIAFADTFGSRPRVGLRRCLTTPQQAHGVRWCQ